MTAKAHVYEGHLEFSFAMGRPQRWVKAEDYEALLEIATDAVKPRQESAWVLVKYIGEARTIQYLTVDPVGVFDWSPDNLKALRLCRRQDGDALAAIIDDAEAVEEHGWGP